jgi:hypothetical protein
MDIATLFFRPGFGVELRLEQERSQQDRATGCPHPADPAKIF